MKLFFEYCCAVVKHWSGWITGGVVASAIFIYQQAGNNVQFNYIISGVVLAIFVSSFQAWKEMKTQAAALQETINRKPLRLTELKDKILNLIDEGVQVQRRCEESKTPGKLLDACSTWNKKAYFLLKDHFPFEYFDDRYTPFCSIGMTGLDGSIISYVKISRHRPNISTSLNALQRIYDELPRSETAYKVFLGI